MVSVFTNATEYMPDIAEIVRAYLGFVEITVAESYDSAEGAVLELLLRPGGELLVRGRGRREEVCALTVQPIRQEGDGPLYAKRQEKRALKIAAFRLLRQLYPEIALPWGSLTGIRPTKLLRELQEAHGEAEAMRIFREEFDVSPEKAALAEEIVHVQSPILRGVNERDVDVYIGIPFCKTRCLYCSFASEVVKKGGVPQEYLLALYEDIRLGAKLAKEGGYRVRCAYVGGGTPTVLSAGQLKDLLAHARACYGTLGTEVTVEAGRPDTVDIEKLAALREMGAGRISLNPQSMRADTLTRIGRAHTPKEIEAAYELAREVGFESINMDVIAGLPGETLADFEYTLERVAALRPESITVHTLAVKRSSKLKERLGEFVLPEAAVAAAMVESGARAAYRLGMRPYYMYRQKYMRGNLENVGYASPGKECVYNIDMMEEAVSILAHGAGAMTKRVFPGRDMRVERIPAPKDIGTYCAKLGRLDAEKRALFLA